MRTGAGYLHLSTHDVAEVLAELAAREIRHVLVEGGPGLATAFLQAHAVDEVHAYLAPMYLGEGRRVVSGLGVTTLTGAQRLTTVAVEQLGQDVVVVARSHPPAGAPPGATDRTSAPGPLA